VNAPTPPIISIRCIKNGDGNYCVELLVSGLATEAQAENAMAHMQRLFCAQEVQVN